MKITINKADKQRFKRLEPLGGVYKGHKTLVMAKVRGAYGLSSIFGEIAEDAEEYFAKNALSFIYYAKGSDTVTNRVLVDHYKETSHVER